MSWRKTHWPLETRGISYCIELHGGSTNTKWVTRAGCTGGLKPLLWFSWEEKRQNKINKLKNWIISVGSGNGVATLSCLLPALALEWLGQANTDLAYAYLISENWWQWGLGRLVCISKVCPEANCFKLANPGMNSFSRTIRPQISEHQNTLWMKLMKLNNLMNCITHLWGCLAAWLLLSEVVCNLFSSMLN